MIRITHRDDGQLEVTGLRIIEQDGARVVLLAKSEWQELCDRGLEDEGGELWRQAWHLPDEIPEDVALELIGSVCHAQMERERARAEGVS